MSEKVDSSKKKKTTKRYRNWVFTLHNFEKEEIFSDPLPDHIRYVIWSHELGDKEKKHHLQGYIEFFTVQSLKAVKKNFPNDTVHLESARGTADHNRVYCSKENTHIAGPWEYGEKSHQGRSCDLQAAIKTLKDTGSLKDVAEKYPIVYAKYTKGLQAHAVFLPHPQRSDVRVLIVYGSPQTGKSWNINNRFSEDEIFEPTFSSDKQWFDGYSGQKTILIDEFRPSKIPLGDLNRIMDSTRLTKEVKGTPGGIKASWTTVIITTNYDPKEWYNQMRDNPLHRLHWKSMQDRIKKAIILDVRRPDDEDKSVSRQLVTRLFDKLREKAISESGDYDFIPPLKVPVPLSNFYMSSGTVTVTDEDLALTPPPTKVVKTVSI